MLCVRSTKLLDEVMTKTAGYALTCMLPLKEWKVEMLLLPRS